MNFMKVVILYRPNSEHGRRIEEFIHDYKSRHADIPLEVVNIDTREGAALATLYDVVQYPAILVLHTDGCAQKVSQGYSSPLMDEVVAYSPV